MTGIELKAVIAGVVIALGITAPVPDFIGGLVISLGCAYGVMIVSEPANRLSVWSTIFLAAVSAILAAELHDHIAFIKNYPLQAVMGMAGGLSRFLTEATIGFGKTAKERISDLPNKFKFPGEK